MWNLTKVITKQELELEIQRTNRWLPKGRWCGGGKKETREVGRYTFSCKLNVTGVTCTVWGI